MKANAPTPEYWRHKLLAFLHDPPTKPLDIVAHTQVRETLIRQAGLEIGDMADFEKHADWIAAGADRFPFPDHKKSGLKSAFTGGTDSPFRHPLGMSDFDGFTPLFPSAYEAEDIIQTVQKGIHLESIPEPDRAWANFFLHWRRWPVEAAFQDSRTVFLPADTRIPDHTVWCHNSLVSALQGCLENGGKPAFLLFQLGPVQEFIAQARSTRDLWSGSYLLSWLTGHAVKAVTDCLGPDHVIFPSLRGIPLFDLLHKEKLYDIAGYKGTDGSDDTLWERMGLSHEDILTPALPNRFLALVPSGERGVKVANQAESAARQALEAIADDCWEWFAEEGHPLEDTWRGRFDQQIKSFLNIAWHVTPWSEIPPKHQIEQFLTIQNPAPQGAVILSDLYRLATRDIPKAGHADERCVKNGELTAPGFTWPYEYARAARSLDARRQLRDFEPWPLDHSGSPKDSLSGKEEIIGNEKWWEVVTQKCPLAYHFRSRDRFGAVNLCKKVWHVAHLKKRFGLDVKDSLAFESVPGVAAGQWRLEQLRRVKEDQRFCNHLIKLREAVTHHSSEVAIEIKSPRNTHDLEKWLAKNDPEIFREATWEENQNGFPENDVAEVLTLLRERHAIDGKNQRLLPPPPSSFAVLALDGDEMGKWIGGENTPELFGQLSGEAREYFAKLGVENRLDVPRPVSPAYHLQFSEALANFALYLARPVVAHFGGQLIYAGGDDVLAMLPASEALRCAQALRLAFRGEKRLCEKVPDKFEVFGTQGGFVKLQSSAKGQPTWPLIVPGPRADVSVGIAMAHAHSPLQNVVRAAQAAEKRAKNRYGRKAFAVTLYKRSGETIEWGAQWSSGALDAYDAFLDCWRGDPGRQPFLSGGFPHALVGLLNPYELEGSAARNGTPGRREDLAGFPFQEVILRELSHVLQRQADKTAFANGNPQKSDNQKRRDDFIEKTKLWLANLCAKGERPLPDFANLFRVAAFLERGE